MNRARGRPARINVKALLILVVVTGLLGVGALVGHRVRKRIIANNALTAGRAALAKEDWAEASKHLLVYLLRYPDNAELLRAYARARLAIRPFDLTNIGAAIDAHRRLLRLRPGDAEASHSLSRVYFDMQDFTESAYISRQRLSVAPEDAVALTWLGRSLAAQRKHDDARQVLERLVELHPNEVRGFALLSGLALGGGDDAEKSALMWLDRAIEANPESAEAWARRARFYRITREDPERARSELDTAESFVVHDPRVVLLMCDEWTNLGDLDRAQADIETVETVPMKTLVDLEIDIDGFAFARLTSAGKLALLRGEREKGIELADQALEELPTGHRIMFLPIAVDLYLRGDLVERARESLSEYREAILRQDSTGSRITEELTISDAVVAEAEGRAYAVIGILADLVIAKPDLPKAWRLLWRAYEKTGQQRRALHALESYATLRPRDTGAMLILAETYRNRDWGKVLKYAGKMLQTNPDDPESRLLHVEAQLHNARGRPSDSRIAELRQTLESLLRANPETVSIRLVTAFAEFLQGDPTAAAAELKRAIQESNDPLTAAMQLAQFHQQRGQLDEAIEVCHAAMQRHPDIATPWLGLAELQLAAKRVDEAREMLQQAVRSLAGAQRVRAVYALVQHLLSHEERSAAIELLTELAAERSDDVRPRVAMLSLPEIAADNDEASRLLAEVKLIEGESGVYWRVEQARLWLKSETWRDRQQDIEQALTYCSRIDPEWAAPVMLLGYMYEQLGNNIQAEQTYRKALRQFPDEIEVVSRLLSLLEREGRFAEAQVILDRLPEKITALSAHRVQVALGQGEFTSAIEELERRIAFDSNDAGSRITLARLVYKHEDGVERSLALLDEAARISPDELSVVSNRAAILHFVARDDEAVAVLDRAVEQRADFAAYRLRADFYETIEECEQAERDYRHLTTLTKAAGDGYAALGAFFLRQGKKDEAVAAWESGLESDPENPGLLRMLASALLADVAPEVRVRGRGILEQLVARLPDDLGTLMLHAAARMREGTPASMDKAEEILERLIKLDPRHPLAHLRLITIARNQGDLEKAEKRITRALGLNPTSVDLILAQSSFEADRGNPRIARELARSVIQSDPKNVTARNLLSGLAMHYGNLEAARALNTEALELEPTNETARLVRAKILRSDENHEEAIRELEAFCETKDGRRSVKAVLALAQLHREQKDFANSERYLAEAEQLAPNDTLVRLEQLRLLDAQNRDAEILSFLAGHRSAPSADISVLITGAWILASSEEDHYRREAISLFEQIIAASPDRLAAHLGLAQVTFRTGEIEAAVRAYRRLLEVEPFHGNALNDLSWILSVELGRHEEALKLANRGVARYPTDPHLLDTRGVILTKLGRLSDAKTDLEECIKLSGAIPRTRTHALMHLADVFSQLDEADEAAMHWEKALRVHRKYAVLTSDETADVQAKLNANNP